MTIHRKVCDIENQTLRRYVLRYVGESAILCLSWKDREVRAQVAYWCDVTDGPYRGKPAVSGSPTLAIAAAARHAARR